MSVSKWPIDFEALKKGSVISEGELEEALGLSADDPKFSLARLQLQGRIESELAARGEPVTVRSDHGSLRVCTDSEALEHNSTRFKQAFRSMGRTHRRTAAIDQDNLSDHERKRLEREIELQGAVLFASKRALRDSAKHRGARLVGQGED